MFVILIKRMAWETARSTRWIDKANNHEFILAFGQAKGELNEEREELVDTFWDLESNEEDGRNEFSVY